MAESITAQRLDQLGFSGDLPTDAAETTLARVHLGRWLVESDGAFHSLLEDGLVVLTPFSTGLVAWRPLASSTAVVVHEAVAATLEGRLEEHHAEVARLAATHGAPVRLRPDMARALTDRVDRATALAVEARLVPAFAVGVVAALGAALVFGDGAWPLVVAVLAAALVGPVPGVVNRLMLLVVAAVALQRFDRAVGLVAVGCALLVGALVAAASSRARRADALVPPRDLGGAGWLPSIWTVAWWSAFAVTWARTGSYTTAVGALFALSGPMLWLSLLGLSVYVRLLGVMVSAMWASHVVEAGPLRGGAVLVWGVLSLVAFARMSFAPRPAVAQCAGA